MGPPRSSIVFVSTMAGQAWGGSEELWSRTAAALVQRGHDVFAELPNVANRPAHPRIDALQKAGVRVEWWPAMTFRRELSHLLRDYLSARLQFPRRTAAAWFKARLEQTRPALVVFSSGNNDFPMALINHCRDLQIPYALISQAIYEYDWPADDKAAVMRDYYRAAAAAYFVCLENLVSTRLMTGVNGANFHVARNPCNVPWDVAPPWPAETGIFRFAFVGRLEPDTKGCDLLLRALTAPAWRERPAEFHFYGTGKSEAGVHHMAEMLGVAKCVFHGQVEGVAEIWQRNHILVLPSRFEGLPLAIVEAMFCARPCLVTDVAGNAEFVVDGVSGFVAAGPTVACVAATLERAWAERANWPRMGEAAAAAIRANFPADPVAELTENLQGLLTNRPPAGG